MLCGLASLQLNRSGKLDTPQTVDVSNWLRPDAATSPGRLFCHVCRRERARRR
jgi:hypothetical protein